MGKKVFYACVGVWLVLNVGAILLLALGLFDRPAFGIWNKSQYPEIAEIFLEIKLTLRSRCFKLLSGTICSSSGFTDMFTGFPSLNGLPSVTGVQDIPLIFASIPSQNPYVLIPGTLTLLWILLCMPVFLRATCWKKRKTIIALTIMNFVTLLGLAVTLGVFDKIYDDILPKAIDKPLTVELFLNDEYTTVTRRPSEVGIVWGMTEGRAYIASALSLVAMALFVGIRWCFEGHTDVLLENLY